MAEQYSVGCEQCPTPTVLYTSDREHIIAEVPVFVLRALELLETKSASSSLPKRQKLVQVNNAASCDRAKDDPCPKKEEVLKTTMQLKNGLA